MTSIGDFVTGRDGWVYDLATDNFVGRLYKEEGPGRYWNATCGYSTLYAKCQEPLCQSDRTPRRRDALIDLIAHYRAEHVK